jgi:Arabinose-binding domain of AraC transcription regulator, N-term
LSLLIRWAQRARCQAETPLSALFRFPGPALTGRRLLPLRVQMTHRREGDCSELNRFFGCDVELGAAVDEVAFAPAIKDLTVVGADPYLNNLLVAYCEEALARRPTTCDQASRTPLLRCCRTGR